MEVSAGEYGFRVDDFLRMLQARAVDVLQADVTRCGGFSGFLAVAELSGAFGAPLSAHTAPAVSLQPALAAPAVRHIEYFHDHVRIEGMLFDGVREPEDGELRPDLSRSGLGLEFKRADAERYLVWGEA